MPNVPDEAAELKGDLPILFRAHLYRRVSHKGVVDVKGVAQQVCVRENCQCQGYNLQERCCLEVDEL